MDKETIDYGIEKLNEAFIAIKPDAIDLGQEYLDFFVFRECLSFFICLSISILLIGGFFLLFYIGLKKDYDELGIFGLVCGIVSTIVGLALSICFGYKAILAVKFPLMAAISYLM